MSTSKFSLEEWPIALRVRSLSFSLLSVRIRFWFGDGNNGGGIHDSVLSVILSNSVILEDPPPQDFIFFFLSF